MSGGPRKLLLASGNAKKRRELEELLSDLDVTLVSPAEVGGLPEVDEDRPTFEGNALKKALSGLAATGLWTLADDSGLEVDVLGGAPGVFSARYAGPGATDADNNAKLLAALGARPPAERAGRFVCVLVLVGPGEEPRTFRGEARGTLLDAPRGSNGFGYDPLFRFDEPGQPGAGRTFAELSGAEKGRIGHRGRALRQLVAWLVQAPEALS